MSNVWLRAHGILPELERVNAALYKCRGEITCLAVNFFPDSRLFLYSCLPFLSSFSLFPPLLNSCLQCYYPLSEDSISCLVSDPQGSASSATPSLL
mmetsp:Transcript_30099/g.77647  ORF Transcript_30099/g.77647 Transcript_30099/m.77647 type:complete len:96 (+) Transcript_30099:167-454(+)